MKGRCPMRKTLILFITMLLTTAFVLTGCSSSKKQESDNESTVQNSEPKQFQDGGAAITLTTDFVKNEQDKYTFQYSSPSSLCIGQKELKTDIASTGVSVSSPADYAKVVMQNIGIDSEYYEHGQALYFEWDKYINDTYYSYIGFVTETDDSYWMVQFATLKESYSELRNDFFKYYDSFTI